jgi:hypothetical protein
MPARYADATIKVFHKVTLRSDSSLMKNEAPRSLKRYAQKASSFMKCRRRNRTDRDVKQPLQRMKSITLVTCVLIGALNLAACSRKSPQAGPPTTFRNKARLLAVDRQAFLLLSAERLMDGWGWTPISNGSRSDALDRRIYREVFSKLGLVQTLSGGN